jgi:flagellar biosynthetic protein FliR
MTLTLFPEVAWLFFLMFARVGTLIMLMPGVGETLIPARIRLGFALAASLVLYPFLSEQLPSMPSGFFMMVFLLIQEILIGFFIGLSVRLILSALQTAGNIIAFQIGLGFATTVDPNQAGVQSALIGNFLGILGTVMIFATDLHHLALMGLVDSFQLFPAGSMLPLGDGVQYAVDVAAKSFEIAIQIAAPFLVFGLVFYLGLGVLSRLMPQLQIFMIAMPASIMGGFVIFALLLSAMMMLYLDHLSEMLSMLLVQGE